MVTIKCMDMNVYRYMPWVMREYDPTNGGISGATDTVYIPCADGYLDIDENDIRLMKIVFRDSLGKEIVHLEPYHPAPEGHTPWMDGGNYAASCDSRVSRALHGFYGAVPIHDRTETWDAYEVLSR